MNKTIEYFRRRNLRKNSTPICKKNEKEPGQGTTKCYKNATSNIIETGKRFTLLTLPIGPFDNKEQILSKLLSYALERIKIRRVYIDRGFFDATSINVFNRFHLKYLIPATKVATVQNSL